jgi:hypothetical protein
METKKPGNQDSIVLTIETPKGVWENATFDKTTKISEVIQQVVVKYKFATDGSYQLKVKGQTEVLKPERTLVSYHFEDHTTLVFTDLGAGA